MTKPMIPMTARISSQDTVLTPYPVNDSDATDPGGTSASARGTSSGLTARPP